MRTGFAGILKTSRGQVAPIAAIALFGFSMSMSYPLISLLLERMGASPTVIGLNAAGAALAMIIGAPLMPVILKRFGLIRLMIASCLLMAAVMASFPLMPDILAWALLRIAYGFAGTALFFASEYWVVGAAPDHSRGRIISIYAICVSVTFMLGPLALRISGIEGAAPFILAVSVILIGMLPILWGRHSAPPPDPQGAPAPRKTFQFFLSDPTVIWGVVLFGATEYGALALLPIWTLGIGLGEADAVQLLAIFAFGSILLQWPVGWAADRFNRRLLLAGAGLICVFAPVAMSFSTGSVLMIYIAATFWGGAAVALYTLALTELGARYSGTQLSEANASVIVAYGVGALISPALYGLAMEAYQPHGLLWASALAAVLYLALVTLRAGGKHANTP